MLLKTLVDDGGEYDRSPILKTCCLVMLRNKHNNRLLKAGRSGKQSERQ